MQALASSKPTLLAQMRFGLLLLGLTRRVNEITRNWQGNQRGVLLSRAASVPLGSPPRPR